MAIQKPEYIEHNEVDKDRVERLEKRVNHHATINLIIMVDLLLITILILIMAVKMGGGS